MSFMPELDNLSLDELIARFRGTATGHEGYEDSYYSEVAHQIWFQHDEPGKVFLLDELERVREDETRQRAVLGSLWFLPAHDPVGTQINLFYLDHANESIVMEAIDGLSHLDVTEAHDRVLAHLAHASQYVIGAVLRYLRRLFPEEAKPILYKVLSDRRYIVRECAVDELDELGDAEAASLICPLVNDPHPDVRSAARWYFESLAYVAEADEET